MPKINFFNKSNLEVAKRTIFFVHEHCSTTKTIAYCRLEISISTRYLSFWVSTRLTVKIFLLIDYLWFFISLLFQTGVGYLFQGFFVLCKTLFILICTWKWSYWKRPWLALKNQSLALCELKRANFYMIIYAIEII